MLALLLLFNGLGLTASASGVSTDGRLHWKQDFSGLTANIAPEGMTLGNIPWADPDETVRSLVYTNGVQGMFGKPPFETSFMMETQWDSATLPAPAGDPSPGNPQLGRNFGNGPARTFDPGTNNIFRLSFDYAMEGVYQNTKVWLTAFSASATGGAYSASNPLAINAVNGAVTCFGQSVGINGASSVMPKGTWVHFDYVMRVQDPNMGGFTTVDVYVNGIKRVSNYVLDANRGSSPVDVLTGIKSWRFDFPMSHTSTSYPLTKNYLDNFSYEVRNTEPVITPLILTHNDATTASYIDNVNKTITIPSNGVMSISSLLSGLSGPGYASAVIKDPNGVDAAGNPTEGSWLAVTTTNGHTEYYLIHIFNVVQYLDQPFDQAAAPTPVPLANYIIYNKMTAMPLADKNQFVNASGLGGKAEGDQSLVLQTANLTEGSAGGANTPMLNFDYGSLITEEVTVEASILARQSDGDFMLQLPFNNDSSTMKDLLRLKKDGSMWVNGVNIGRWQANRWYKVAATIKIGTPNWDVYVNGTKVVNNQPVIQSATVLDSVWRMKLTAVYPTAAGNYSGFAAIDDMKLYSGGYDAARDIVTVAGNPSGPVSVDEQNKTIYYTSALTVPELAANLALNPGAALTAVYADSALTQKIGAAAINNGDVAVFTSAGGAISIYTLSQMAGVVGIQSASYSYDNASRWVTIPVGTAAGEVYNHIALYPNHTGAIIDAASEAQVDSSTLVELDSDVRLKYRIAAYGQTVDYALKTKSIWQDMDSFAGKKYYRGGNTAGDGFTFTFPSATTQETAYAQGESEGGNPLIHFYSAANSVADKITLRRESLTQAATGDKFVLTWNMKTDRTGALNTIVATHAAKDGTGTTYWNLINFEANGTITFSNASIPFGSYEPDTWYKFVAVMDTDTTDCLVFINGQKVYDNKLGYLSNFGFFRSFILTHGVDTVARNTYMDHFHLYPIASLAAFDPTQMQSNLTSDKVVIDSSNVISGYGYATVSQFKSTLVTLPDGATLDIYADSGAPVQEGSLLSSGMKAVVTARDPNYSTVYTLGERIHAVLSIKLNGRIVDILYPGTASAEAEVAVQGTEQLRLVLERYKDGQLLDSAQSGLVSVSGRQQLSCVLEATVEDEPGVVLKASLVNEAGAEVAPVKTISYSDVLQLGTEIMKVKDNRKGIYTITMDDGYKTSSENFYQPWFEQYDLHGSPVVIYNWMFGSGMGDQHIVNSERKEYFDNALISGRFEMGSHSTTHVYLSNAGITDAVRDYEIVQSQSLLKNLFPAQEILTYTPAGNAYDPVKDLPFVKSAYWAMRSGTRGTNPLNTLTVDNMYQLKIRDVLGNSDWRTTNQAGDGRTTAVMNSWIDSAIANREWMVEMWHTIGWADPDTGLMVSDGGYLPIGEQIAEEHLSYAAGKQQSGELWVATFGEAVKYQRERLAATLVDQATKTSRVIQLTDTLPDSIFQYPLTLKSEVPADWLYADVLQDGRSQAVSVVEENGKYFIYYDAVPDRGDVIITKRMTAVPDGIATAINVTAAGPLSQQKNTLSPIVFQAGITSDHPVDESKVEWYVNGVKQYSASTTFTYTPSETIGKYGVTARVLNKNVISGQISYTNCYSNTVILEVKDIVD